MINRSYQGRINNAQGQLFEGRILAACEYYRQIGRADIHKTPEPFRCLHKTANGRFTGQFISKAQPDFCGTLQGGDSIIFEAKYTLKDQISKNVLTTKQVNALETSRDMGAYTFICFGIKDQAFAMPYFVWADMKNRFGHSYVTRQDAQQYKVKQDLNCILFLDKIFE